MSEIIRAYELKKWDLFRKQGVVYLVLRITDKEIIYSGYMYELETYWGRGSEMGKYSQERVEYVGVKPEKKKTKPFKEDYFI